MGLLSAPLAAGRKASAGLMGFVDDVFHGSTHNIDDFSKAGTLNPEGHFGAGHYFTSSADDASRHYAGLGPDLTNRIEQRMDAIDSELDGYEFDDLLNAFPQMTNKEAKSISSGNSEVFDDFKRRVATKELAGDNSGAVYPIKLRSNKTYDLRTKEDTFMKYERDLPDRDDLADEIRDELDINDYDDKSDFDDAVEDLVDERYYDAMNYEEPQGELADFMLSLSNQADEYGFDASDLMSNINEAAMDSDGLTALELDDIMRTTEWYADNDQGKLINNEVYRKAIEDSGFDTIKHKGNIFNGMDVEDDTVHTIVFDPSNIRSKYAKFDPAKSNSSNILASNPAATAGAGILGLGAAAQSNDTYADFSPSNLARLRSDDVGSIKELPQDYSQQLANAIANQFGGNQASRNRRVQSLGGILDFTPVGGADSMREGQQLREEGNTLEGLISSILGAAEFVPLAGQGISKGVRGARGLLGI